MTKRLSIWIGCLSLVFCCACNEDNSDNGLKDPAHTDNQDTDKPTTNPPDTNKPGTDTPGTNPPGTDKPGTDKPVETNPCPNCEFGCDAFKQCYTCDKGLFACSEDNTAVLKCTKGQYSEFKKCKAENPCGDNTCGDFNENHLKDEYEPQKSTDCVKNSDCDSGFCDRLIMKCSVKCTDDTQCMKGNLCRSDGYCAPEAFVTEWAYDVNGIEMTVFLPTAYADECDFTVDWGDGSEKETYHSCPQENIRHSYPKQYDAEGNLVKTSEIVTITGKFNGWRLRSKDGKNPLTNASDLKSIHSFGPVGLAEYAFCSLRPIDISKVDIPNADLLTTMDHMFYEVKFTYGSGDNTRLMELGTLPRWDVSNVTNMSYAFAKIKTTRNLDLSKWDTSNVKDMSYMFYYSEKASEFGISNWDVSHVTNLEGMFQQSYFNEPIGSWDVSNVTNMSHTFDQSDMAQDISNWKTSKVTDMSYLFANTWDFKGDISRWDVSNVTNMEGMFSFAHFNPAIGAWKVGNVTNMKEMFSDTDDFDINIGLWDVSHVTNMNGMFRNAQKFNQMLDAWDVSQVTDMSGMFKNARSFNNTLRHWNVSNVTNMSEMFMDAEIFNQEISDWNVKKVTDFTRMFYRAAAFDQNLSNWKTEALTECGKFENMFYGTKIYNSSLKCSDLETLLHESWGKTSCTAKDIYSSCN